MKQIQLIDNTLYTQEESEDFPRSSSLDVLKKENSESVIFLRKLSSNSIQKLNEKEEGILVWPNSFNEGKDDLKDMKIVECVERNNKIESLRTGNLVGWIGNGKVQIEINSRFSHNNEKKENQDYFLYYMLSKVFHMNIVDMEVGGGSLKE